MPDPQGDVPHWPSTLDEAVKDLISKLSLKDKTLIAKISEDELTGLHPTLGAYIREQAPYAVLPFAFKPESG